MKLLSKNNTRKDLENKAYDIIMRQKDTFTLDKIVKKLRSICDEEISNDIVEETVINAFDYCMSQNLIDFVEKYTYMVDPVIQFEYENKYSEISMF